MDEENKQGEQPPNDNRKSAKHKRRWSFPTVSPCRRCGSTHTQATSTQGRVQYRKCLGAVCRHRYTVTGTPVNRKNRKEQTNE